MKKSIVLLSSLLIFGGLPLVKAQDVEELQQQVQSQMQDLSDTLAELRKAYNEDAMKVGDPIVFESGLIVTLEDVEITQPGEYEFNEITGTMVRFDITVDNQTSEEASVNAHSFDLYDGDRIATDHLSTDYFSVNIAPGMKAQGSIYYDIQNLGTLTLMLEEGVWTVDIN